MQEHSDPVSKDNIRYFTSLWSSLEPHHLFPAEAYILQTYLVQPQCASSIVVADLACGAGRVTQYLLSTARVVIGVDIVSQLLERAHCEHRSVLHVRASLTDLPITAGSVDFCICAFNGLDYVYPRAERRRALKEMARVLKPGGIVAFSSHNLSAYFTTRRILRTRSLLSYYRRHDGYLREHTGLITHHAWRRTVTREVSDVGLELLEVVPRHPKRWWDPWVIDPWLYYVCRRPWGDCAILSVNGYS